MRTACASCCASTESNSNGELHLELYDPEPFSAVEDRAIGYGLRGVPVDRTGETVYFGLVGSNTLDDERTVPFFRPDRERFLEYDITRLVHELSDPRRPVVGVLSPLPLDGDPAQGAAPWVAMTQLRQAFAVRRIALDTTAIDPEVQVLMAIHPQDLSPATLYAIDQFVMRGGRLLAMVDPHSETQAALPEGDAAGRHDTASDLRPLLAAWGVAFDPARVVGDPDGAWRVRASSDAQAPPIDYLPWFNVGQSGIAADDPATGDLEQVTVAAAGSLARRDGAAVEFLPLLRSSPRAGLLAASMVNEAPDPAAILDRFKSEGGPFVLAARLRGTLHSAFASPPPGAAASGPQIMQTAAPANVVVVADTDVLADRFWVRTQDFLGQPEPVPFSDNGALVVNLAGTLAGGDALLGLRARGGGLRPLERIDAMQHAAEAHFRDTERQLQTHLDATRKQLDELRAGRGGDTAASRAVVSAAQQQVIEELTREVADTRGRLRRVQLDLRRDIDRLEGTVRLLDIAAVPLLLVAATLLAGLRRRRRTA